MLVSEEFPVVDAFRVFMCRSQELSFERSPGPANGNLRPDNKFGAGVSSFGGLSCGGQTEESECWECGYFKRSECAGHVASTVNTVMCIVQQNMRNLGSDNNLSFFLVCWLGIGDSDIQNALSA